MADSKPRLAWFATRSQGTLSSFVTKTYLPHLSKDFEIAHFVGDREVSSCEEVDTRDCNTIPIFPFGNFYEMQRQERFALAIYCLERDANSEFAWATLGVQPGVVLLLEDFAPAEKPWLFQSSYEETQDILTGSKNRVSLEDKKPYPVDAEIRAAQLATKLIVSSEEMLERIPQELHYKCAVIPFSLPAFKREKIQQSEILEIGVCSPATEDFLISKIFLALKNSSVRANLNWLAGNDEHEATLRRKEAEFNTSPLISLSIERRSFDSWEKLSKKIDLALHLQGWGRESLEPYLGMSLCHGNPTVVSNFGVGRLLPSALGIKIPIGLSSAQTLESILKELATHKSEWPMSAQRTLAGARYDVRQNTAALSLAFKQSSIAADLQLKRLENARLQCRQKWVAATDQEIGIAEIGNCFSETHIFLQGLEHG